MDVESLKKTQKDYTTPIALVSSNIKDCTTLFIPLKRDMRVQRYEIILVYEKKNKLFYADSARCSFSSNGRYRYQYDLSLPYSIGKDDSNKHKYGDSQDYYLEHTLNHLTTLNSLQAFPLESGGGIPMMMVMVVMMLLFLLFCHYFLDIV